MLCVNNFRRPRAVSESTIAEQGEEEEEVMGKELDYELCIPCGACCGSQSRRG